ncbi:MAG: hypothetical protein NW207_04850 [Cytophagales bacterium]|nr:hypothetical protein [Cytophagales bacterium]
MTVLVDNTGKIIKYGVSDEISSTKLKALGLTKVVYNDNFKMPQYDGVKFVETYIAPAPMVNYFVVLLKEIIKETKIENSVISDALAKIEGKK